jgi:hypothetical protein
VEQFRTHGWELVKSNFIIQASSYHDSYSLRMGVFQARIGVTITSIPDY